MIANANLLCFNAGMRAKSCANNRVKVRQLQNRRTGTIMKSLKLLLLFAAAFVSTCLTPVASFSEEKDWGVEDVITGADLRYVCNTPHGEASTVRQQYIFNSCYRSFRDHMYHINETPENCIQFPKIVKKTEIEEALITYLNAHHEVDNLPAWEVVQRAVSKRFPCSK